MDVCRDVCGACEACVASMLMCLLLLWLLLLLLQMRMCVHSCAHRRLGHAVVLQHLDSNERVCSTRAIALWLLRDSGIARAE